MKKLLEECGYNQDFTKTFIRAFVKYILFNNLQKQERKEEKENKKSKFSNSTGNPVQKPQTIINKIDNENTLNENKKFPKIKIVGKGSSNKELIEIKKSVTKQEESIISGKTKDTNKNLESLIPSLSISLNNNLGDDTQLIFQDFIKNGKKEIIFQDSNSKEFLLGSEKPKGLKIKIKDPIKYKKSITSEEKNDSIKFNEQKKKKDLYDANKVLYLIHNSYLGFNENDDEEEDNEETLINDDYGNLDEIVSDININNNNNNNNDNFNNNNNNIINNINNNKKFVKNSLNDKDKDDIQVIRNKIESKLGKEFTKYLINYVSSRTDKELLKFDQKEIEKELKRKYDNGKIKINSNIFYESLNLLPEIYSFIIAERMENNK